MSGFRPWLFRACLCAYALAVPSLWAQTAPTDTGTAPSGNRDTLDLLPAPAARPEPALPMAAKTAIELSDQDRQLGNLGDLLQRFAGLHVARTGGIGDYLGVSVRGSSESQVNIYVDGILRNQATDPSLFLGDWDLSRIERIEVHKGLAPDHLPGSPMGGAINIVSRKPGKGPGGRAALGAGSFGSRRANGSVEHRAEKWRGRIEASRDQADGDFTYYDDGGTEFGPGRHPEGAPRRGEDDLIRKTRRNNSHGFSRIAADLSFIPPGALETGIQMEASRLDKQVAAPNPNIDSNVAVSAFRKSDRAHVRGYGRWTGPEAEASLDVSGAFLADAYVDTSKGMGSVGLGYDNDRNVYSDFLASLWGRKNLARGLSFSALAAYGVSGYHFTDRIRGRSYPGIFRYTGEAKITPAYQAGGHAAQVMLAANLSQQDHPADRPFGYGSAPMSDGDRDGQWSLRFGYQYRPADGFWISAQGGSSYRVPTFLEKFGDRGSLLANPSLRSETGLNGSLGLHASTSRYSAEVQAFAAQGRRIISLVQNSQYVLVYRNTGATRVHGLEARMSAAPVPWTRIEMDATLQKAVDISGGSGTADAKLLPNRPVFQASLRQILTGWGWSLKGTAYYQGLAYPNSSNVPSIFDSYSHNTFWQARGDVELSWRLRGFLVAAGARNLTDQRHFDFFNYPLPGRSFAATVQAEI